MAVLFNLANEKEKTTGANSTLWMGVGEAKFVRISTSTTMCTSWKSWGIRTRLVQARRWTPTLFLPHGTGSSTRLCVGCLKLAVASSSSSRCPLQQLPPLPFRPLLFGIFKPTRCEENGYLTKSCQVHVGISRRRFTAASWWSACSRAPYSRTF